MFTKEFIKISQILDNHGMHRQADDLLKIAQAKPPAKNQGNVPPKNQGNVPPKNKGNVPPKKPAAPTARPVLMMNPSEQNKRIEYYQNNIKDITSIDSAKNLAKILDSQYKNNYLDYNSYVKLITDLKTHTNSTGLGQLNVSPINPINPTAFPTDINATPTSGRGTYQNSDGVATPIGIQLATPLEGLTAAGEKALPNREDRNLPKLVNEWNDYLKTQSFKDSILDKINTELGGLERAKITNPDLVALYEKANGKDSLQVGDFGNNGKASEVYGVEAKPLTSITGTPTTPAPGTAAPVTPNSAARNPGSR